MIGSNPSLTDWEVRNFEDYCHLFKDLIRLCRTVPAECRGVYYKFKFIHAGIKTVSVAHPTARGRRVLSRQKRGIHVGYVFKHIKLPAKLLHCDYFLRSNIKYEQHQSINTQNICLCICSDVGFDALDWWPFFSLSVETLLEYFFSSMKQQEQHQSIFYDNQKKSKDFTTVSKLLTLTSVRIKYWTLQVLNKNGTIFGWKQITIF